MKLEQRRRLTDLYARGKPVSLYERDAEGDPVGEPVKVWVRKMTGTDNELAYTRALARRAGVLAEAKTEPPSDLYYTLQQNVAEMTTDQLIDWLTTAEMFKRAPQIRARIALEEEWTKDRYLDALVERANEEEFAALSKEEPENAEVKRISDEIARYAKQVGEETDREREDIRGEWSGISNEELCEEVLANMLESNADEAWFTEYRMCKIWLSTFYDDNHSERYFFSRKEVDTLQDEIKNELLGVIEQIEVSELEGKGSRQIPASSEPSE